METGPATRMFAGFFRTLKTSQESHSSKVLREIRGLSSSLIPNEVIHSKRDCVCTWVYHHLTSTHRLKIPRCL